MFTDPIFRMFTAVKIDRFVKNNNRMFYYFFLQIKSGFNKDTMSPMVS